MPQIILFPFKYYRFLPFIHIVRSYPAAFFMHSFKEQPSPSASIYGCFPKGARGCGADYLCQAKQISERKKNVHLMLCCQNDVWRRANLCWLSKRLRQLWFENEIQLMGIHWEPFLSSPSASWNRIKAPGDNQHGARGNQFSLRGCFGRACASVEADSEFPPVLSQPCHCLLKS